MTENQRKKFEKTFYILGWGILAIVWFIWLLQRVLGFSLLHYLTPCMFYAITGIYCPGCGGTRAVLTLLEGNMVTSLLYHPLVPYTAVICAWFMISHTIEVLARGKIKIGMHYSNAYLWIALVLVVLNVIVKNIFMLGHIDPFLFIERL